MPCIQWLMLPLLCCSGQEVVWKRKCGGSGEACWAPHVQPGSGQAAARKLLPKHTGLQLPTAFHPSGHPQVPAYCIGWTLLVEGGWELELQPCMLGQALLSCSFPFPPGLASAAWHLSTQWGSSSTARAGGGGGGGSPSSSPADMCALARAVLSGRHGVGADRSTAWATPGSSMWGSAPCEVLWGSHRLDGGMAGRSHLHCTTPVSSAA